MTTERATKLAKIQFPYAVQAGIATEAERETWIATEVKRLQKISDREHRSGTKH